MSDKTLFEDILSLGGDVLSSLIEARQGVKARVKERACGVARELELVEREEFDAAFAMLAKIREAQEDLAARVEKIEAFLNLSRVKKTVKTKKSNLHVVKTKSKGRT